MKSGMQGSEKGSKNIFHDLFNLLEPLKLFLIAAIANGVILSASAQDRNTNDTTQYLTIEQCIAYGLKNQPTARQSALGVTIAEKTNAINISAWLPQVNFNATFTHYLQLPTSFSLNSLNPDGPLLKGHPGVINTLIPQLTATQTIFSPDVLYAANSAHLYVQQAQEINDSTKINIVSSVSKAFYDLLHTIDQINVLKEDTTRLGKNLRDAYHQYVGGIVDKSDYKEASISLNNSRAQLKQAIEAVRPQYAALKLLMGYPQDKNFNVKFDTAQMIQEIAFDTSQQLQFEKRIEFQQIQTAKKLQEANINYYRTQFAPTLSAFYFYNYEYENNAFSSLIGTAYPFSYFGATLSLPLFTGFRRIESIQRAKLQKEQINWSEISIKSRIYSEYSSALANYKSNVYDFYIMKENVAMAKDVYGIVKLQYKQGIVAYLNVITAESNLISSEINYSNALFQLLQSKVDLEKAMGNISAKQ